MRIFRFLLFNKVKENFPIFIGLTFVKEVLSILWKLNNKELLEFTKIRIDLLITFAK